MKQNLIDALQQIRHCRNNMTKEEFFNTINEELSDNNVLIPLLEVSTLCTQERLQRNVANSVAPKEIKAAVIPRQTPLTRY